MTIAGSSVPADHIAFVLFGGAPRGPGLPIGNGCITQIDLNAFLVFDAFPTGTGADWTRQFAIANDGGLVRAQVALWALYVPSSLALAFQATPGILLTAGR